MKEFLGIVMAAVIVLSLVGCANTQPSTQNAQPSTQNSTVSGTSDAAVTDVPITESSVFPEPLTEKGILGLYAGGYDYDKSLYTRFVLAWVDPETGDTSVWREFCSDDSNVIIDPNHVLSGPENGKALLRQSFDSSYERILAKNNADGSWGWVDTTGTYTNVTGMFGASNDFYRAVHGVGFYNDCYYMSSEKYPKELHDRLNDTYARWSAATAGGGYPSSEAQALNSQYLELMKQIASVAQLEMLKVPLDTPDIDHVETIDIYNSKHMQEVDFLGYTFIVQSNANHELAYVYNSRMIPCPVFCEESTGKCVLSNYYGDWMNADQCLYSDNGRIRITKSILLDDRTKEDFDSTPANLFSDKGTFLDSPDCEYDCPILNPSKDCVVSIVEAKAISENGKAHYSLDHLGIYSVAGEEQSALSSAVGVSTENGNAWIKKLLDWRD